MNFKDKMEKMAAAFKKAYPDHDSVVSTSGLRWSDKYDADTDVDIIYGEPESKQVIICRFTYKNKKYDYYVDDKGELDDINDVIFHRLKDKNNKLTKLYKCINDFIDKLNPSKIMEPKLLRTKYLNVDKTYDVSDRDENCKKNDNQTWDNFYKEHPKIITNITTVSDYLRAITLILSNWYILKVKGTDDIRNYENIFSYPGDDTLSTLVKRDGLFFRGESKNYNYQIPSLYRKLAWIKNENKILNYNKILSPESLGKEDTVFDNITILQHHGGVTRILDITSNALIALYFAVSNDKDEDGFVYLVSGKKYDRPEAKKKRIKTVGGEIKYPDSISVLAKASISELTFDQKEALFKALKGKENEEIDLKLYAESLNGSKTSTTLLKAVEKIYSIVQRCLNSSYVSIKIKDVCGVDIVQPFRTDRRIIQQSSAFLIFGLENLDRAFSKRHYNTEKEKNECMLEDIQKESSDLLYDMDIIYSPEHLIELKTSDGLIASTGNPRIQIRSQYKKRILDELDILGINEGTVYPDINHKARRINDEFSF